MREGRLLQMCLMTLGAMLMVGDGLPPAAATQVEAHPRALCRISTVVGVERISTTFMYQVVGNAVQVGIEGHVINRY